MKLKELIKNIPDLEVKGLKDVEITGLSAHSKSVAPGNLFIAKKGKSFDGNKFIVEALDGGALCILADLYDPTLQVTQLIHSDINYIESELASVFYGQPSQHLPVIGITGTSGKTTTSYLIKYLLDSLKMPAGLIGTIEWIVKDHHFPSTMTTPDVITNQKLLKDMISAGCKAAVMEVSSHALDQKRVALIQFQAAIFTNLTQDHLDYHGSMEQYALSKKRLFDRLLPSQYAIINQDDPYHGLMVQDCSAQIMTYGLAPSALIHAANIQMSREGTHLEIGYQGKYFPFYWHLIGRHNVYNLLAALATGHSFSFSIDEMLKVLKNFKKVPGRLEKVENRLGFSIFVDYAHKIDALLNVLMALRELKQGRIVTVFGCGGNRDRGKRKKMGQIAQSLSDIVVVTSDNPRNEDPQEIIREILEGIAQKEAVIVEPDRKKAIERAIEIAGPSDIVLIAGKGHETYQIFSDQKVPFDDREIALEICKKIYSKMN